MVQIAEIAVVERVCGVIQIGWKDEIEAQK
jgi:hypothetical protein